MVDDVYLLIINGSLCRSTEENKGITTKPKIIQGIFLKFVLEYSNF